MSKIFKIQEIHSDYEVNEEEKTVKCKLRFLVTNRDNETPCISNQWGLVRYTFLYLGYRLMGEVIETEYTSHCKEGDEWNEVEGRRLSHQGARKKAFADMVDFCEKLQGSIIQYLPLLNAEVCRYKKAHKWGDAQIAQEF